MRAQVIRFVLLILVLSGITSLSFAWLQGLHQVLTAPEAWKYSAPYTSTHPCSTWALNQSVQRYSRWQSTVAKLSCRFENQLCLETESERDKDARSLTWQRSVGGTEYCKEIAEMEAKYLALRRQAGNLSCQHAGIGPSGGFCLARSAKVNGNSCINEPFARKLGKILHNASVIDLGCGAGQYGRFWKTIKARVRWVGVDGAEGIEELTKKAVRFADLSEGLPIDLQHPWDFAMSIEVAEHVPRLEGEATFLHNLVKWAQRGILLSWATPGSDGHHHVNCQPVAYVRCVMHLFGWVPDLKMQERLIHSVKNLHKKEKPACSWLRQTLHYFKRATNVGVLKGDVVFRVLPVVADESFKQSYLAITEKICHPVKGACISKAEVI